MLIREKLCIMSLAAAFAVNITAADALTALGDGVAATSVSANAAAEMPENIDAECVYVCEIETGKILFERNSDKIVPMGHFAKLMTALLAAEALESGDIALDDLVTVSSNANSKQGTQIWLDAGEKISVEELIKSITIGNANDANTALAEKIAGSEEMFIEMMNDRAKSLKMTNTYFADSSGMDINTVSAAEDIAKLSSELAKHDSLTEYYTVWMDRVRSNAVELVSTNRLVRTCKGLKGGKSCSADGMGESLSVWVKRGDLSVCTVILGCDSTDDKFSQASELLDTAFRDFRVYSPEISAEFLEDITVTGGEKLRAHVKLKSFNAVVVPAGVQQNITFEADIKENIKAPVKKGDKVGKITYTLNSNELLELEIVAAESVDKMTFLCAVKKNLLNLFNLHNK